MPGINDAGDPTVICLLVFGISSACCSSVPRTLTSRNSPTLQVRRKMNLTEVEPHVFVHNYANEFNPPPGISIEMPDFKWLRSVVVTPKKKTTL
jgi:hypothetical protein